MEADWEVEIGPGAPVIDLDWPGKMDLHAHPELAFTLPETQHLDSLAQALQALNRPATGLATSKCDVWTLESFDPDELDAPADAAYGQACYIDLAPRAPASWATPEAAIAWSRQLCSRLRPVLLRGCRIDLVVRAAAAPISSDQPLPAHAVTAYVSACSLTLDSTAETLGAALSALVAAIPQEASPKHPDQKLQWKSAGE